MIESQASRLHELFEQAVDLSAEDRSRFLDERCGSDAALRLQVETLLEWDAAAGNGFLERSPIAPSEAVESSRAKTGKRIGIYTLVALIGEGGFGEVWTADQLAPLRRQVAMKIIKAGMDSKEVLARFEAERQALALMDHPHVAKVFDAGQTETGRPYFVMEHVPGLPITEYCDAERLPIRKRLNLFVSICRAVQHAHQKGIIHRDLKPSNILVTVVDGKPVPKVIDFGIAKATTSPLTERTLHTEMGRLMGTPEYMSPEQAGSGAADVDTRTDVYSLGVILYQLLTGTLPFEPKTLRDAGYDGVVKIIREMEPPRPSTRLSTLSSVQVHGDNGATPMEIAAKRNTGFALLRRQIRGELDWIVMKCLEKDRTRRYDTANALAMDIGRHLAGEPIVAAPPSSLYRARKFVRRNRTGVLAASLVAAALVLGVIGTSVGLVRAKRAEDQSKQRANDLEQVVEFQQSQLAGLDATKMGVLLRRDIMERRHAAMEFDGLEDVDIKRRMSGLEQSLHGINFTDVALRSLDANIFEQSLSGVEELFADHEVLMARLLQTLANTMRELGLLERAYEAQSRAVAIRRRVLGDLDPDTLSSIHETGVLLRLLGKPAEAEAHVRQAMDGRRRVLGDTHLDTLSSIAAMRGLVRQYGDMKEAEQYYREAAEGYRQVLGINHPTTLHAMKELASLLGGRGKLEETEIYAREVLEGCRRVFGDDHPDTLSAIGTMIRVLEQQGRSAEAEPYVREALAWFDRLKPGSQSNAIIAINNMTDVLIRNGRLAELNPHYKWMIEHCRHTLGDDHPETFVWIHQFGLLLRMQGRRAEAVSYLRTALDGRRRVLGDAHPHTLGSMMVFGILLRELGQADEALPYILQAVEGSRRLRGDDHPWTIEWMSWAGVILYDLHRLDESERIGMEAVQHARNALLDPVTKAKILSRYARTLIALDRFRDAESVILESHALCEADLGTEHEATKMAARQVARLYVLRHEAEPHVGYDVEANAWWLRSGRIPPCPAIDSTEWLDDSPVSDTPTRDGW